MMNFSLDTVTLNGWVQLVEHRFVLLLLFLLLYVFVMLSDGLVVYIICSQRSLHTPMFVFIVAVLANSMVASSVLYPKMIWDLAQGSTAVVMPRWSCVCQAYVMGTLGCSSFLLLAAMAADRYLSICHPLRYSALMSPAVVSAMLGVCWSVPALYMTGALTLASRVPPCVGTASRLFCDTYTLVSMGCPGRGRGLSEVYGLFITTALILVPIVFVLFSYARILVLCLQNSPTYASKALSTCLPHVIVFVNYSMCIIFEVLHRRIPSSEEARTTVATNILVLVIPTVGNPVVYGLKVGEIFQRLKKMLLCDRRLQ